MHAGVYLWAYFVVYRSALISDLVILQERQHCCNFWSPDAKEMLGAFLTTVDEINCQKSKAVDDMPSHRLAKLQHMSWSTGYPET